MNELESIGKQVEDPALWDKPDNAQKILKRRDELSSALKSYDDLVNHLKDNRDLLEIAEEEADESIIAEVEEAFLSLHKLIQKAQLKALLSGEADACDTYMEINAGAGGTEAQDWAEMLSRMYMRWAESKGYKLQLIDENPGDEAGIKSITYQISGHQAYGWLKSESGVHRLVRISPFDSNARRHTSFASVWVYPVIDDKINIVIEEKDLRIDTYRASGAGGQHVNKTESAVRITHLPTNIAVQCQTDRSQHKNRAKAYEMLRSRLYEHELQKKAEAQAQTESQKGAIGWGHQIRSYVLQPYQLVKDTRTGMEKGNAAGVLDGDIDDFLEAALSFKIVK